MKSKKKMVVFYVFYLTELEEIMDASYSNKGVDVRELIRKVWEKKGRKIKLEK